MRSKRRLLLSLFWLLGGFAVPVAAQQNNPFDLLPRITGAAAAPEPDSVQPAPPSGNPFDIVAAPPSMARERPALRREVSPVVSYNRLKLFIILGILILLAFLITVLRVLVNKSLYAFFNETVMNQLHREQDGRGILPFLILYGMFFINAGVFLFFLLQQPDFALPAPPAGHLLLLLYCILGVSILFLLKHSALNVLAFIFSVQKEVSRYNFTIIVFGIVIGLFLVPVNILIAYTSSGLQPYVIYGALGTISIVYLFRYLRGLLIANNFLLFHKFHFLLYICTVEIAPALFLLKLILN